jgi:hypothetical protein
LKHSKVVCQSAVAERDWKTETPIPSVALPRSGMKDARRQDRLILHLSHCRERPLLHPFLPGKILGIYVAEKATS